MPPETPRCIDCGYDLTGAPARGGTLTCPECSARQTLTAALAPRPLLWPGWVAVAPGVAPAAFLLGRAAIQSLEDTIVTGMLLVLCSFAGPLLTGLLALPIGAAAAVFAPGRWRIIDGAAHAVVWAFGLNMAVLLAAWPLAVLARAAMML